MHIYPLVSFTKFIQIWYTYKDFALVIVWFLYIYKLSIYLFLFVCKLHNIIEILYIDDIEEDHLYIEDNIIDFQTVSKNFFR